MIYLSATQVKVLEDSLDGVPLGRPDSAWIYCLDQTPEQVLSGEVTAYPVFEVAGKVGMYGVKKDTYYTVSVTGKVVTSDAAKKQPSTKIRSRPQGHRTQRR